jgi:hypothetical protein
MKLLTLQEVVDRINQANSLAPEQQAKDNRIESQPSRPEFYISRVARRLAILMFGSQVHQRRTKAVL